MLNTRPATLLLICALLTGCQTLPVEAFHTQKYYAAKLETRPNSCDLTGTTIQWVRADDLPALCGMAGSGGCYFFAAKTIYAAHPSSWNDVGALIRVGHEVLHACGAVHE